MFTRKKSLLILRLDSIGDYVLFRNFIKVIGNSSRFKDYKITLCGNIIWKDLAECFDTYSIHRFIWVDKNRFWKKSNWVYHYKLLLKIYFSGFEFILIPNDTKYRLSDYLMKNGYLNGVSSLNMQQKEVDVNESHDNDYLKSSLFQFNKNKKFIESITNEKCSLTKPFFEIQHKKSEEEYIVIFPNAANELRKWSEENFVEVIKKIRESKNCKIIICGHRNDNETAVKIIRLSGISSIINMTGKTTLPELVRLISGAALVISNETCAVHIAASVDTPVICVSNGNHFGRFNPYPEEITPLVKTVYPAEIETSDKNFLSLVERFKISSDIDINKIKSGDVMKKFDELLSFKSLFYLMYMMEKTF